MKNGKKYNKKIKTNSDILRIIKSKKGILSIYIMQSSMLIGKFSGKPISEMLNGQPTSGKNCREIQREILSVPPTQPPIHSNQHVSYLVNQGKNLISSQNLSLKSIFLLKILALLPRVKSFSIEKKSSIRKYLINSRKMISL